MSVNIQAHGPYDFTADLTRHPPGDFVTFQAAAPGARIALLGVTRAECDAAIRAWNAAKDLLPEPPGTTAPDAADPTGPSASGSSEDTPGGAA